jgi:spore germination protein YaaH
MKILVAFFGKECDAIVLMNTDQHWISSPPGPVAAKPPQRVGGAAPPR